MNKLKINENLTFKNLEINNDNRFACTVAKVIAEKLGNTSPFYIYGKNQTKIQCITNAIANSIQPQNALVFIDCDEFISDVESLQDEEFNDKYLNYDVLTIHSLEKLECLNDIQKKLLFIFEKHIKEHKQIIVSSSKSLKDIIIDNRLKSIIDTGIHSEVR